MAYTNKCVAPLFVNRLLGYASDLKEIVLAKCFLKGKVSKKCKVNQADIEGASTKPTQLHLENDETNSLYHGPIQECDHDRFQRKRGYRKTC